jgi:hypothetical protein
MPQEDHFIDIDDPDQPICRISRLPFFENELRSKQLVLVGPHKWEDPFEVLLERTVIEAGDFSYQIPIEKFLTPAFGQCWSKATESDTLWRAYSKVSKDPDTKANTCPEEEGVQVWSTPRKLIKALVGWSPRELVLSCFIGSVRYLSEDEIKQHIAKQWFPEGKDPFADPRDRAELLLLKRPAFSHEEEVRLIYVDDGRSPPGQDVVRVPIDPNELYDQITFDPRLNVSEREKHKEESKKLGYKGSFVDSDLYQGRLLQIIIPES